MKSKKIFLILYTFVAIFEPPILPVSFIYIFGIITLFFIILQDKGRVNISIFKKSKMDTFFKFFLILSLYILLISGVDVLFIGQDLLLTNRLKGINQLLVLTGVQFLNIYVILREFDEIGLEKDKLYNLIVDCATIQGVCSVLAYCIPTVRTIFLKFSSDLYQNPWILERRGYGFSSSLIDIFGYGMGLAAGYVIFTFKDNRKLRLIQLSLILFSIWFNSRTGLVVFLIACFLKLISNGNIFVKFGKVVCLVCSFYYLLPKFIEIGLRSTNITFQWVATDFGGIFDEIMGTNYVIKSVEKANQGSTYFNLLSDFLKTPENLFQKFFGTGYSVYSSVNNYRTDMGYTNITWMFGIIGSLIFYGVIIYYFKLASNGVCKKQKQILLFNLIAYFVVLVKGRLIGYGPGIFINYLVLFSTFYFSNNVNKKDEKDGGAYEKI